MQAALNRWTSWTRSHCQSGRVRQSLSCHERFRRRNPVKRSQVHSQGISNAGEYVTCAFIIQCLGLGPVSIGITLILVCISIIGSYLLLGTYLISLAADAMICTLVVTMDIDACGPVAGNAGCIEEMADLDASAYPHRAKHDKVGDGDVLARGRKYDLFSGAIHCTAYGA